MMFAAALQRVTVEGRRRQATGRSTVYPTDGAGATGAPDEAVLRHATRRELLGHLPNDGMPRAILLAGEAIVRDRLRARV